MTKLVAIAVALGFACVTPVFAQEGKKKKKECDAMCRYAKAYMKNGKNAPKKGARKGRSKRERGKTAPK